MLVTQIQRHTTLVPVDAEVVAALAPFKWWAPGARVIADAWLFDFDDIGAHITQHLGAVGACEGARQVKDAQIGEWQRHSSPFMSIQYNHSVALLA
jgi:hypothetical protein